MDKRTFLKTSGTLLTGAMLSPLFACEQARQTDPRTNWPGNVIYSTERLSPPGISARASRSAGRIPGARR